MEKRYSECRDCWTVRYGEEIRMFDTEEQADEFITERKMKNE